MVPRVPALVRDWLDLAFSPFFYAFHFTAVKSTDLVCGLHYNSLDFTAPGSTSFGIDFSTEPDCDLGYTSICLSFTFPANLVFGIDFIYLASSPGGVCAAYQLVSASVPNTWG